MKRDKIYYTNIFLIKICLFKKKCIFAKRIFLVKGESTTKFRVYTSCMKPLTKPCKKEKTIGYKYENKQIKRN